jgi:hypothetical protein
MATSRVLEVDPDGLDCRPDYEAARQSANRVAKMGIKVVIQTGIQGAADWYQTVATVTS